MAREWITYVAPVQVLRRTVQTQAKPAALLLREDREFFAAKLRVNRHFQRLISVRFLVMPSLEAHYRQR